MKWTREGLWATLMFLQTACNSVVAGAAWPPAAEDVCVAGRVDRPKMADYLLRLQVPSFAAADYAYRHPNARFAELSLRERLIADIGLCAKSADAKDPCGEGDFLALTTAYSQASELIDGSLAGYTPIGPAMKPVEFFLQRKAVVNCAATDGREEQKSSGEDKGAKSIEWRLRGQADELYARRDDDTFKSAGKAQIAFSDDQVKAKRAKKIVGSVGAAFTVADQNGTIVQVVPYVGIDRDLSNATGSATKFTADTRDVGVVLSYQFPGPTSGPSWTNVVTFRPDYLWNNRDESRLRTLHATYVPFVGRYLNSPIYDGDYLTLRSLFDLRVDEGNYTSFGRAPANSLANFFRVGTRIGLNLTTFQNSANPLDFLVAETYLHGVHGTPEDIRYFKASLSLGLNATKDFSLDLNYSNGRLEDTSEQEKGWSIGFSAKY